MNRYLKLVNFEFNRFAKLFMVLLGITAVVQIIGVIIEARKYLSLANEKINEEMMSKADFIMQNGEMSFFQVARSVWFLGPIALCVAAVAFYIFFIWYRDWLGKNTFIYRLLMLPTARINVFYAKITTIMLATLGFVAFQLILLPIETTILKWMIPRDFRLDMGVTEVIGNLPELQIIFPTSITEFILYYSAGLMAVSILFTAILFERSFKWKGIIVGAIYSAFAVVVILSPLLLQEFVLDGFFYPIELLVFTIVMGIIVLVGSTWVSGYLLKKKVTV